MAQFLFLLFWMEMQSEISIQMESSLQTTHFALPQAASFHSILFQANSIQFNSIQLNQT